MIPTMTALTARTIPLWMLVPITILLSAMVGYLDYHADEVQGAVLLLIILTGGLAFASPSYAWLVALIMGLSIAGTYVVANSMGLSPVYPMTHPISSLIALIPAAIGAASGAGARVGLFRGVAPLR